MKSVAGGKYPLVTIACDIAGCPTLFRSYSEPTIVREQAAAAGWIRTARVRSTPRREGKPACDLCPVHAEIHTHRMSDGAKHG